MAYEIQGVVKNVHPHSLLSFTIQKKGQRETHFYKAEGKDLRFESLKGDLND